MLYVTEEQHSRRPIFIATVRAARLLAGCFVAHPAKIRCSATTPVTDLVHLVSSQNSGSLRRSSWDRPALRTGDAQIFLLHAVDNLLRQFRPN
jgi:hypothetical protein